MLDAYVTMGVDQSDVQEAPIIESPEAAPDPYTHNGGRVSK